MFQTIKVGEGRAEEIVIFGSLEQEQEAKERVCEEASEMARTDATQKAYEWAITQPCSGLRVISIDAPWVDVCLVDPVPIPATDGRPELPNLDDAGDGFGAKPKPFEGPESVPLPGYSDKIYKLVATTSARIKVKVTCTDIIPPVVTGRTRSESES